MLRPLLSALLLQVLVPCSAQVGGTDQLVEAALEHRCVANEAHEYLLAHDPAYAQRHADYESDLLHRLLNGGSGGIRSLVTIPVVVHIIHNGGLEDISDAQVIEAIAHMNAAFANTGYYDPSTGVDTEIQFCLAVRDPDNEFTTGIDRVQSPLTDMVMETQDLDVKGLSRWDPFSYMNIWVVRSIDSQSMGSGVAGYAYLPAAHGTDYDGLLVEAEYFGSSESNSVVAIHEAGHYLGLYHTFQGSCPNNDCLSDGDRVCDTPPDASTASVACSETMNTCTSDPDDGTLNNPFRPIGNGGLGDQEDLLSDYMDYGNLDCKSVFTQGQKDRMQETLAGTRHSLLESYGCVSPCTIPFAASFTTAPPSPVAIGSQLVLNNTTGAATTYTWLVNGTPFSSNEDEVYDLGVEGNFTFTLVADDSVNHCHDESEVLVEVICPGEASFIADATTIPIGGDVLFTNTSTASTSFQWYLDGSPHATTEDDSIHFDTPGIYTVYLVAQTPDCPNTSTTTTIQVGQCPVDGHRMNWHFGNHAGLDFNSGTAIPITNSPSLCYEGSTDMSDDDGNLLFYSNGKQVWARNNVVMSNGSGLLGGQTTSSRNQALAAHRPGHPDQYLLFTHDEFENDGTEGLRYSVIDMTLDAGYGAVTALKNVLISAPNQNETMAGTYAANGEDIWLLEPRSSDNILMAYLIDGDLNFTEVTTSFPGYYEPANVSFSQSGKKVHLNMFTQTSPPTYRSRIFDFDLATGQLSNPIDLPLPAGIYQVEFSPDGSKLYVPTNTEMVQYDLSLTTELEIQNSATVVATGLNTMVGMRAAPDGRIYFAGGGGLRAIAQPNLAGTACDVQATPVDLAGHNVIIGLPLFMRGRRVDAEIALAGPDSVCIGSTAELSVIGPDTSCTYSWYVDDVATPPTSGDTLLVLEPSGADSVLVRVDKTCGCGAATRSQWIHYAPAPDFHLANDTAICLTATLLLDPGPGYSDHLWQNGSTNSSYLVTSAGTYWLQATDPLGCTVSDTVEVIESIDLPSLDLGPNDTLCVGTVHVLDAGPGFLSYDWQDGSTEQTFTAWEPGTYWVMATNGCGTATDTITLALAEAFPFSLGEDNALCVWEPTLLQAPENGAHFLWQDGSAGSSYLAEAPGTYWVEVTDDRGCSARDTITLGLDVSPPEIACPPDTTLFLGTGNSVYVQLAVPAVNDPCGATLVNDLTGTEDASGIFPLGSTTITWTATDGLGNSIDCTTIVTVSNAHGLEEAASTAPWLQQNPGEGLVVVHWGSVAPGSFQLFDALGRSVQVQRAVGRQEDRSIDLSDQAAGVYRLLLWSDGRSYAFGVVLAR